MTRRNPTDVVRVLAHEEFLVNGGHGARQGIPRGVAWHQESHPILLQVRVGIIPVPLHLIQPISLGGQLVRFPTSNRTINQTNKQTLTPPSAALVVSTTRS